MERNSYSFDNLFCQCSVQSYYLLVIPTDSPTSASLFLVKLEAYKASIVLCVLRIIIWRGTKALCSGKFGLGLAPTTVNPKEHGKGCGSTVNAFFNSPSKLK